MKRDRLSMHIDGFWRAVWALLWRELLRFRRELARMLGFAATPFIFWLLIGSGFGDLRQFFPGSLLLTVMFSAAFSTMSLIEDRREGFLLSVLVSPAPRSAVVLGKVAGAALPGTLQGLTFLAFAPLAGFEIGFLKVFAAALLLFTVALACTCGGFLLAWVVNSTQGYHAVMNLIVFPLWLLSGALFPASTAHAWVRTVIAANPASYPLAGLQRILESNHPFPAEAMVGVEVAFAAAVLLFTGSVYAAGRPAGRLKA